MAKTRQRYLVIFSALLLLSGCGENTPKDHFDEYLTRIANVQSAPKLNESFQYVHLPEKRVLTIEIERVSLNLVDSYSLRKCGLFALIAEKNSILGKVADPFRNYDYQSALLSGLKTCIESKDIEPKLKQTLEQIYETKQKQLVKHQWNLVYMSDAMRNQLNAHNWFNAARTKQLNKLAIALQQINSTFSDPHKQSNLVQWQEFLDKQTYLGELNYSLSYSAYYLELVTKQLWLYDTNIVCNSNRDKTQFYYLNNVFNQQYLAHIQPYLANLDSAMQNLLPHLGVLEFNKELASYSFPIKSHHLRFQHAAKEHVRYWQSLFKRCGHKLGS